MPQPAFEYGTKNGDDGKPIGEFRVTEFMPLDRLDVEYGKPWMVEEDDVEQYLDALKVAIMKTLQDGKGVQV